MKYWQIFILSFFLAFSVNARPTRDFGQSSRSALPASYIKALVWNIHAGKDESFASELKTLNRGTHLQLFQEADLTDELESILLEHDYSYTHARSYTSALSGAIKGVATASVARATNTRALRSTVNEFGVVSPKAVLLQTFKIENRKKDLLVVNVHAINFVTNKLFKEHMNQIIKAIKSHTGSVLMAGDFNTWNKERLSYLDKELSRLSITRASLGQGRTRFPDLGRWFGVQLGGALDQVYIRDLTIRYSEIHAWSESSDHKPIEIHFSVN
tara:strand:- start:978 stop:1790 length:813 start_codon:yes stop_codon:yes gene_type:complete